MKLICAWCKTVVNDDHKSPLVSHVMCSECLDKALKNIEETKTDHSTDTGGEG